MLCESSRTVLISKPHQEHNERSPLLLQYHKVIFHGLEGEIPPAVSFYLFSEN